MGESNRAEIVDKVRQRIKKDLLKDPVKREQFHKHLAITRPLIAELGEVGYTVDTLDDLRQQKKPWKSALPVLLRWLPRIDEPSVKDSIVRCLSVPWVGNEATPQLIEEFKKYAPMLPNPSSPWIGNRLMKVPEEEKKLGPFFNLAWAIGNALSIVDVKGFEKKIIELSRNPNYGKARQMVVLGLGRLRVPEAEEAALDLLKDEQVQLHAITALGKMKSKRALFQLEELLTDTHGLIRKEARKAIIKIMRET